METSALSKEVKERIKRFQHLLERDELDSALVVQKVDLYYLSGTDQDAHLWIPASGEPLLMVRKSLERAVQDALLDHIVPFNSLSQIPELIREHHGERPERMGLEMDVLPVSMYLAYQRHFPGVEMVDISPLIRWVRMIKSSYEVSLIRSAAEMGDRLLERIPEFITNSETEMDLVLRVESFYRSQGHPGISRMRTFNVETIYGHIMAGPNGAVPSASPGPTGGAGLGPYLSHGFGRGKLAPHEPILVDYTANVEGYLSDQARIFSMGDLPAKFHHAHQIMTEVQEAIAQEGRPGVNARDLYGLALGIVQKAGLSVGFMGHPQPVPFVGHGLGLELDEWPVIGRNTEIVLRKGMVIALEPKIIFPQEGVVGVENTFVVTDDGMEKLSRFPDEIAVIPSSGLA